MCHIGEREDCLRIKEPNNENEVYGERSESKRRTIDCEFVCLFWLFSSKEKNHTIKFRSPISQNRSSHLLSSIFWSTVASPFDSIGATFRSISPSSHPSPPLPFPSPQLLSNHPVDHPNPWRADNIWRESVDSSSILQTAVLFPSSLSSPRSPRIQKNQEELDQPIKSRSFICVHLFFCFQLPLAFRHKY